MLIYEAGCKSSIGKYSKFIESNDENKVDEYIEIMKQNVSENLEIVKLVKEYKCISTIEYTLKK